MRVISLVSLKGGVGKSTLAAALAVRAARESKRVAMLDLDPQASLDAWWKRRGKGENPTIFGNASTASDAVESLKQTGWDWVFMDCPPAFIPTIEDAIEHSDLSSGFMAARRSALARRSTSALLPNAPSSSLKFWLASSSVLTGAPSSRMP